MATTAAVARNLLRNSKSLPQILRGQILGQSNHINKMAKEHKFVQSLFVSNQKMHAQVPTFDFSEMGSSLGSPAGRLSLVDKFDGKRIDEYGDADQIDSDEDLEDFDSDSDDFYGDDDDDDVVVDDDDDDDGDEQLMRRRK